MRGCRLYIIQILLRTTIWFNFLTAERHAGDELEPRRRAATPGPGESVSDMGACGVVGGAESARAM